MQDRSLVTLRLVGGETGIMLRLPDGGGGLQCYKVCRICWKSPPIPTETILRAMPASPRIPNNKVILLICKIKGYWRIPKTSELYVYNQKNSLINIKVVIK